MRTFIGALLALALFSPAASQEMKRGIYCDTAEQAEQLVAYAHEMDLDEAIHNINRDHNEPYACAYVPLSSSRTRWLARRLGASGLRI